MADKDNIKQLVLEHISGSDTFLVDLKLSPNKLVVFIDKPAGITLEECTALSRHLYNSLDTELFTETHEIEVSSPGMDTALVVPQQYLRRIGREMRVFDKENKETRGILSTADHIGFEIIEKKITREKKTKIETEHVHKFIYEQIREAKLIVNFKAK